MAATDGVGGNNRTGGLRLDALGQTGNDPNSIGGMSTKELMEKLIKMMSAQQPQEQGGGQPAGGQQAQGPSGAQKAGGAGDQQFSLEELLKEMQKRAQLNQDEMAKQLRQVNNAQQPQGGQNQTQPGLTQTLLATAPATLDVGNPGLTIQSGGGFSGGGGGMFS